MIVPLLRTLFLLITTTATRATRPAATTPPLAPPAISGRELGDSGSSLYKARNQGTKGYVACTFPNHRVLKK